MTYPEEVTPITREEFLEKTGHRPSDEATIGFGGPEAVVSHDQLRKARSAGEVATRITLLGVEEQEETDSNKIAA
jgi:hypothetical protein